MNNLYQNNIAPYLAKRMQDNAQWYQKMGHIDKFMAIVRIKSCDGNYLG